MPGYSSVNNLLGGKWENTILSCRYTVLAPESSRPTVQHGCSLGRQALSTLGLMWLLCLFTAFSATNIKITRVKKTAASCDESSGMVHKNRKRRGRTSKPVRSPLQGGWALLLVWVECGMMQGITDVGPTAPTVDCGTPRIKNL